MEILKTGGWGGPGTSRLEAQNFKSHCPAESASCCRSLNGKTRLIDKLEARMPEKKETVGIRWGTISDRLRKIDGILNSKREELVKRLREGNQAWEQRKKQHVLASVSDHSQPEVAKLELERPVERKQPRRFRRDNEHAAGPEIVFLHASSAEESERERKASERDSRYSKFSTPPGG